MRKLFVFLTLLSALPAFSGPYDFNRYFINASARAKLSVVNVIAYRKKNINGAVELVRTAYGTGTIISRHGFVVTNYHVVKKGDYFKVACSDGTIYEMQKFENGRYYVSDMKTDLAVLKLENREGEDFNPLKMADSNTLREGEWVLGIGNPYGLKQSITAGIVSSKGRDNIGFTDIEDFIQTDVSINPGNSGGPLINLYGKMVGINTAIRSSSGGFQGISFAIPSNIVQQVCYDLIKYGRVRRGWLGFIAREKNFRRDGEGSAVEIISVIRNSPSDIAGVREGDIIREIDNIEIKSLGALVKTVGNKPVGSKIKLIISRNGKISEIPLILREKSEYVRIQNELSTLFRLYGLELDEDAKSGRIVVSYISPGSRNRELLRGDILLSINRNKISSMEDFIQKFITYGRNISNVEILRDSVIYEIKVVNQGGFHE